MNFGIRERRSGIGVANAITIVVLMLVLSACSTTSSEPPPTSASPTTSTSAVSPAKNLPTTSVKVVGNHLVGTEGQAIRLLGVNDPGPLYACIDGKGISASPLDAVAAQQIETWHANAVRIALNEDCWLGINGASARFAGAPYRAAIVRWVADLNADGMVAVLDLHWSAPGATPSTQQWPMADADHSIAFWSGVASTFKSEPGVIFDLFNEPYLGLGHPTATDWECWRSGCDMPVAVCNAGGEHVANAAPRQCHSVRYQVAGMQQLLNAVRDAGADQPVLVAGLDWASDLCDDSKGGGTSGSCLWLQYEPVDPDHQIAASFHTYNFTSCSSLDCWNSNVASLAQTVPVITGELGERDCTDHYVDQYSDWADQHDISYLAWAWQAPTAYSTNKSCQKQNTFLIGNQSGVPNQGSAVATAFKAHLQAEASSS